MIVKYTFIRSDNSNMANRTFIPNQVFIGCPWKTIKDKYERRIADMRKKNPLSFILIGREETHDAENLLSLIQRKLDDSSYAIFDATNGNANVSLEFGYAEGKSIPRSLYLSSRKDPKKSSPDHPIISDLAGKKYISYKTERALSKHLYDFAKRHPFTKRFEAYLKKNYTNAPRGIKKSLRALSLKVIHELDDKSQIRRVDLIENLIGSGYTEEYIEYVLKNLHAANLLNVSRGRTSIVSLT